MTDLDGLSERLFKHDSFTNELKMAFERFYEQKTQNDKADNFIRPRLSIESGGLNFRQRPFQEDESTNIENKYGMNSSGNHRRESRDSISSMTSNPLLNQYLQSQSSNATLNQITNEISSMLSEMVKNSGVSVHTKTITPVSVESINASELIQKMNELQKEQSAKLKEIIDQKVSKLKAEVEQQVFSIIEKVKQERKTKRMLEKTSQIKRQRKKVTQSILEISKNNQEMSTFSNIYDGGSNILSQSQDEQSSDRKNSPEISQLSQKISEVQKSQLKISKDFSNKFAKEVEQNSKDIQAVTERIVEWKMKNEEKIENGFTGVWNVVTDIQDKLNKVALKVAELEHTLMEHQP